MPASPRRAASVSPVVGRRGQDVPGSATYLEPPGRSRPSTSREWSLDTTDEVGLFKKQTAEYADATSIHGVKYIFERQRSVGERLCWLLLCICSLVLCVILMRPILTKYIESPTITSIGTTSYPIWHIDFPAVTVCSNNKVVAKQLRTVAKRSPWNTTNLDRSELCPSNVTKKKDVQALGCTKVEVPLQGVLNRFIHFDRDVNVTIPNDYTDLEKYILRNFSKKIPTVMQQVMHRCQEMLLVCTWEGEDRPCMELFDIWRTDNGYCCSFNALRISEQFEDLKADDESDGSVPDDDFGIGDYGGYGDYGDYEDGDYGGGEYYGEEYYGDYYDNYGDEDGDDDGDGDGDDGGTTDTTTTGTGTTGTGTTTTTTGGGGGGTTTTTSGGGGGTTTTTASGGGGTTTTTAAGGGGTTTSTTAGGGGGTTTTSTTTTSTTTDSSKRRKRSAKEVAYTRKMVKKYVRVKRSTSATTANNKTTARLKIRKTNSASAFLGLSILLYPDSKNYGIMKNNFYGFRVLVHSPYSFPEVTGKGFAIGSKVEAFIAVTAHTTLSSDSVKSMDHDRRKCLLVGERDLVKMEAFQEYSKSSCLLECRARELFKHCGCLPYYYPNFNSIWKKETACDIDGLNCLANVTAHLYAVKIKGEEGGAEFEKGAECDCPDPCEETVYFQELSTATLRRDSYVFEKLRAHHPSAKRILESMENATKTLSEYYGVNVTETTKSQTMSQHARTVVKEGNLYFSQSLNREINYTKEDVKYYWKNFSSFGLNLHKKEQLRTNLSLVHIYFKELGVVKYERDERYGIMDVIASFGGIIGLCMGFSLLSGAELLYYFTVRLWVDVQREQRKLKSLK